MTFFTGKEAHLYAEVRKRIGVVQVAVLISNRNAATVNAKVRPNAIEVGFSDEDGLYIFKLPSSIRLNPKSCQGLQWVRGEGIHMRLQLLVDGRYGDEDNSVQTESSSMEIEMEAVRQSGSVMFICSLCGGMLLPTARSFSRVLPLPSENWRELSGDWCCHGNDYARSLAESSLAAKREDCFMSELYLSISPLIMDQTAVVIKEVEVCESDKSKAVQCKSPVLCQRCRHVLGEATFKDSRKQNGDKWKQVESVHLYKHSIHASSGQHVDNSSVDRNNIFRNYSLEVFLANHFVSLSRMQTTFKFIVESADDNRTVLLVWLLSADTLLVRSGLPTISCREPFHGCDLDVGSEVDRHDVQCHKIAKILYRHRQDEQFDSLQQQWVRDFGVETVRLPTHACMELLLLLADSTENTPPSLRVMNDFKVGYLKTDTSFGQL